MTITDLGEPGGFREGDRVRVVEGSFQNFTGEIVEANEHLESARVRLTVFNKPTLVEIEYRHLSKLAE